MRKSEVFNLDFIVSTVILVLILVVTFVCVQFLAEQFSWFYNRRIFGYSAVNVVAVVVTLVVAIGTTVKVTSW